MNQLYKCIQQPKVVSEIDVVDLNCRVAKAGAKHFNLAHLSNIANSIKA